MLIAAAGAQVLGSLPAGSDIRHSEGPRDIAHPRRASGGVQHAPKRAKLYQRCTGPTDGLDAPMPPTVCYDLWWLAARIMPPAIVNGRSKGAVFCHFASVLVAPKIGMTLPARFASVGAIDADGLLPARG